MSTRPASPPATSADALRLQMERSVDELAELARTGVEPGRFFGELLRRTIHPGGAARAILWRGSVEGQWEPAGEIPSGEGLDSPTIADRQALLDEVADDPQPRIIPDSRPSVSQMQVFSPLRRSGEAVGILETVHPLPPSGNLPPVVFQFYAALCEIAADFLSQQELQQLRGARAVWHQWDQYQLRIGQSLDLAAVCAAIANDGRVVLGCDRMAVLVRRGRRYRIQAISGVERPDPRAGTVQSLESLARDVSRLGHTVWVSSPLDSTGNPGLWADLDRHCRDSGVAGFGAIVVPAPSDSPVSELAPAVITFENFESSENWAGLQSRAESLVQRSTFSLQAAIERSEIPWLTTWLRLRRRLPIRRPAAVMWLIAVVAAMTILVAVPGEFTVSGRGELWPDLRRDVFATTAGVVDQVLVQHSDEVQQDQPLIVLRDPDLEQEVPRLAGEIATLRERLRSVQIERLKVGLTSDAAIRARQLTAEENELQERLRSLERQSELVEGRRQQLTLHSPISGRVLTWDTIQHLSARPVDRGQALLTIGDTNGPWIVEVDVADKDAGHLLRAQRNLGDDLLVDFQLPSEPGQTYRGRIRNVPLASTSDDQSSGHARVVVEFDRDQVRQLRPGATAVPRIYCGRQPLGYVWLHDLIDAVRIWLFF